MVFSLKEQASSIHPEEHFWMLQQKVCLTPNQKEERKDEELSFLLKKWCFLLAES